MPSETHETLIKLFRDEPQFVATLLHRQGLPDIELIDASLISENASVLKYAERRVDSVVSFRTADDLGLVCAVEVQLRKVDTKLFSWPTYVTRLREDTRKPVALLVICGTDRVANWAGRPIDLGPGSVIKPFAVGPSDIPRIVDPDAAEATAEMTTMSAILHANRRGGDSVIDAMNVVYSRMSDQDKAVDYTEYVRGLLRGRALNHLEALLSTHTFPFHNAFTQRYVAEGKAEGKAEAILEILEARGVAVSKRERDHILACTDKGLLKSWLIQAMKVQSAAELLGQP